MFIVLKFKYQYPNFPISICIFIFIQIYYLRGKLLKTCVLLSVSDNLSNFQPPFRYKNLHIAYFFE